MNCNAKPVTSISALSTTKRSTCLDGSIFKSLQVNSQKKKKVSGVHAYIASIYSFDTCWHKSKIFVAVPANLFCKFLMKMLLIFFFSKFNRQTRKRVKETREARCSTERKPLNLRRYSLTRYLCFAFWEHGQLRVLQTVKPSWCQQLYCGIHPKELW